MKNYQLQLYATFIPEGFDQHKSIKYLAREYINYDPYSKVEINGMISLRKIEDWLSWTEDRLNDNCPKQFPYKLSLSLSYTYNHVKIRYIKNNTDFESILMRDGIITDKCPFWIIKTLARLEVDMWNLTKEGEINVI